MGYLYVRNTKSEDFKPGTEFSTENMNYKIVILSQNRGSNYNIIIYHSPNYCFSNKQSWDFNSPPYVNLIYEKKKIEDDPEYKEIFI